jgi:hypothetical protein
MKQRQAKPSNENNRELNNSHSLHGDSVSQRGGKSKCSVENVMDQILHNAEFVSHMAASQKSENKFSLIPLPNS